MKQLACLAAVASAVALLNTSDVAHACGGCFVGDDDSTVVTGHRMALAISMDQTVLWDQITYDGDPAEFSWVLPIKPGARLEIANDAWFDVLDAGTSVTIGQPQIECWDPSGYDGSTGYYGHDDGGGFGCGSSHDEVAMEGSVSGSTGTGGGLEPPPPPDVTVVHEGTVGPYETVTLSTDIPGVLDDWLAEHGYNVPIDIQPVIDAYVAEGFDFIALRLVPGEQVRAMKPVRVISPGGGMTLPLRMVAAGTGPETAITLFVIGEGRYETQNFWNARVDMTQTVWDFATSSSNYSELRIDWLKDNDGHTWLTSFAKPGVLFSPEPDNIAPMWNVAYTGESYSVETLAEAYVHQGIENGEGDDMSCLNTFAMAQSYYGEVVDTCDELGNCAPAGAGQIAAHELKCGTLDDVAVAALGMHPADMWITRLEAALPRSALADDLVLGAAGDQSKVENRVVANQHVGDPCPNGGSPVAAVYRRNLPPSLPPGGVVTAFFAALALATLKRRRALANSQ